MDISQLTEAQQLALQQYTSVTDQELSAAIPLLEKCQWNAQIAITRFFDGDAETIDPAAEAANAPFPPQTGRRTEALIDTIPTRSIRSSTRNDGLEPAPRVVPTPESQLTQPLPFPFSLIVLPFSVTYTIIGRVLGAFGYLFPFLPRLLSRLYSGRASQPSRDSGRRPLNPTDTAERFIREFEEEYGVTHGTLPFHEGGYAQAFDIAKRDVKHLVVVLLSPEHDDTAGFVRDTFLAPEFVNFLKNPANNIILWAGTVQDAEAYQVASALNVTRFPYACLILHTPSVSSTTMSKVTYSAGPVTASDLMSKLQTAMQTHHDELERVRQQRQEQQATRSLRQEQESAYERSLAQDREKARKRKEEAEALARVEREKNEQERIRAEQARNLHSWRRWRAKSIAPEPSSDDTDAVRISLRMPDGERVIRRFAPATNIEELYAFVECYEVLEDVQTSEKETEKPANYKHEYRFSLVSPMPREVFDLAKGGTLRQRIGRSGNLIVERNADDDDDDEKD